MSQVTIIQVSVQIAITRLVGVTPNLITTGKTIVHPVIPTMHLRTTITVNVPLAIQLQVGLVRDPPMPD
jgi:hypothetical protein